MNTGEPMFIEVGVRLYEIVVVTYFPRDEQGRPVLCLVNHSDQRIELSMHAPEDEREALVAQAIGLDAGVTWRLVPVRGRVA
jgi:hypothetical protein